MLGMTIGCSGLDPSLELHLLQFTTR
ncbi:hypothetical protein Gohar_007515 [Gossypium harknessii]|uniref:Uncharacterized protein n=3 Tax=Gossypium TaxID=3633 RepID=A0A7J8X033_GOSAI|nr:hypothetical protein [Gossypium lobatum]MBA0680635.1 hypothetical protein [Gossypium aridum]MBA0796775.1 hypothetical protein [Gossypium harknessii]